MTGSRDRIQIYGQQTWFLNFRNAPLLRWRHCHFQTRLRWKRMGEITFIEKISTKFLLCLPRHFLLVHWLNSWLLFVHSANSIMFFKFAKRLFQEPRRKIKICPRTSIIFCLFIEIYCSAVEAILNYHWRVLNVI